VSDSERARRFREALRSRETIALATGVVMERYGLEEDAAFAALIRLSLRRGEPLRDEAEAMRRSAGHSDGDTAWYPDA
jgi:AmiR/NasT family two-component response regulator